MLLSPIFYNGTIIFEILKSVSDTENFNPCYCNASGGGGGGPKTRMLKFLPGCRIV